MLFFNTKMPVVVAIIIIIEIAILYNQWIAYLARSNEKKRLYHFLILLVLMLYNIAEGFLPDENIAAIPIMLQNFLGYAFGYIFAACCPVYFYKTMDLPSLRFHGVYGFLFIIIPLIVFYGILYPINQDIALTRKYVYIIPAIYAISLFWTAIAETIQQYKADNDRPKLNERLCIYCAVVPVTITPLLGGWLGAPKWLVTPIFNIGFLIANAILMRQLVRQSKQKYNELQLLVRAIDQPEENKEKQTIPLTNEMVLFDEESNNNYQYIKLQLEELNQGPYDFIHQLIEQSRGYLLSTQHNCVYSFCLMSREITTINADNIIDFIYCKEPQHISSGNTITIRYNYKITIAYGEIGTKPLIINPSTERDYENWYTFIAQIFKQKGETKVSVQGDNNIVQLVKGDNGLNTVNSTTQNMKETENDFNASVYLSDYYAKNKYHNN